jgi:hypothetical protein
MCKTCGAGNEEQGRRVAEEALGEWWTWQPTSNLLTDDSAFKAKERSSLDNFKILAPTYDEPRPDQNQYCRE